MASASGDRTVKLWDASSGVCLQTLNIGRTLSYLSFDSSNSCLCTETGTIVIQSSKISSVTTVAEPDRPLYLCTSLGSDNTWIKHDNNNMLWIPSEYRPSCSSVCRTTVGMGAGSGKVWTCSIDLPHTYICL
jgi:WD40 repeat protein